MFKLFVTGTDTGVGKTVVSALLARYFYDQGYKVAVYKPVETGVLVQADKSLISQDLKVIKLFVPQVATYYSYLFQEAVAPSVAADIHHIEISIPLIKKTLKDLEQHYDIVLIEGAGGFLVPLYKTYCYADLIQELCLETLLVARPNLGTINHTLLSMEAIRSRNINPKGIVISNYPSGTKDPAIISAPKIIQQFFHTAKVYLLPAICPITDSQEAREVLYNSFYESCLDLFDLKGRV